MAQHVVHRRVDRQPCFARDDDYLGYRQAGRLSEGRFKSALVDIYEYVFACYRYIELNPPRAAMVRQPREYGWSSYACNAAGVRDARITPHATYRRLGATDLERQAAYTALVAGGLDDEQTRSLAVHTQQQRPWGSERFRRQIEALTSRAVDVRPRGRPAKRPHSAQQIK